MPRKLARQRLEESMLEAAGQLFMRHGFEQTSMDEIAKQAKVAKQTLYSHFGSKEELFRQMLGWKMRSYKVLGPQPPESAKPADFLLRLGQDFFALISSCEGVGMHCLLMNAAKDNPELAQIFWGTAVEPLCTYVSDYLAQQHKLGRLVVPKPRTSANHFFALLKGMTYMRLELRMKPVPTAAEKKAHVADAVELFLRAHRAD